MKSNKGFTLIELLAVIVILAIIALIATPRILDVVEDARKGAAKSSILGYIDAIEKQVMLNEMDEQKTNFEKPHTGYTVSDLTTLGVNVKGDLPDANGTSVDIDDKGAVATTSVFVTKDGKYTVTYVNNDWVAQSGSASSSNNANA